MKKKLIPLIISVIILIAGCVTTVVGIAKESGTISSYSDLDLFGISDEDVEATFQISVYAEVMHMEDTPNGALYLLWLYNDTFDEATDLSIMCFDVPNSLYKTFDVAQYNPGMISVCGTVHKSNEAVNEKMGNTILDIYNEYKEIGMETDESMIAEAIELFSPYYIEVAEAVNGKIYIWIGCAAIAVAVFMLFLTLFGKKFLIVFAVLIVTPVIILLISLAGKLRTMSTVTETADGLYTMTCYYNYKCDKFLDADISTVDELSTWMAKEHFFGLPFEFDAANFGCSAFTAETPDGQRLFCRNFDYNETDTLVIYTEPKGGYASYGVVDLRFFDIGTEGGLDGNSIPAKAIMLCAPYATMDGINEAGLGVGILQLDIDEIHQDNGKSDLLISSAIRGILDKCATVDEAIDFLSDYDIHSCLSCSYHLFITDRTGKSVIVEWTDSETFIVEDTACTNDVMSNNEFYNPEWVCERYDTIKNRLSENNGILTEEEAMSVTSDASWVQSGDSIGTQWSSVYNLDEFTLNICLDRDYENIFSFTREDFR